MSNHHLRPVPWHFLVTDDLHMNERGAALFMTTEEGVDWLAYWDLKDGRWLRVCLVPDADPGIVITVDQFTVPELVKHIRKTYPNWKVRSTSLDDFGLPEGPVQALDPEPEQEYGEIPF